MLASFGHLLGFMFCSYSANKPTRVLRPRDTSTTSDGVLVVSCEPPRDMRTEGKNGTSGSDDVPAVSSPKTPEGPWADGPPATAANADASETASPTATGGLAQQSPVEQAAASKPTSSAPKPSGAPRAPVSPEDVLKAITGMRSELLERINEVERKATRARKGGDDGADGGDDSGAESDSSESSSGSSSRGSSDGGSSQRLEFCPINEGNPHWGARDRAADADLEPRRYSLYGNKTHDALAAGKHEGGGLFGFSLGYPQRARHS
jgi:hypothetical protein